MRIVVKLVIALTVITTAAFAVTAQTPSAEQIAEAEKAFGAGNTLMGQRKSAEALIEYKKVLAIVPKQPAVLFNAGMAAFASKDYTFALDVWTQLKAIEPNEWSVRAKLIQTYQALNKMPERDAERAELFEMWKKGSNAELKEQFEYCRDQFEVKDKRVMAFEHFELKGDRALRYVFSILNEAGDGEEWRISLGSYDTTNRIWREMKDPKPKENERLFHLDGYFKGGGHATYGMHFPEPSYDEVRAMVVKILEGKGNPISSSTPAQPKPEPSPKPN